MLLPQTNHVSYLTSIAEPITGPAFPTCLLHNRPLLSSPSALTATSRCTTLFVPSVSSVAQMLVGPLSSLAADRFAKYMSRSRRQFSQFFTYMDLTGVRDFKRLFLPWHLSRRYSN